MAASPLRRWRESQGTQGVHHAGQRPNEWREGILRHFEFGGIQEPITESKPLTRYKLLCYGDIGISELF